MPRVVEIYACEICGTEYRKKDDAIECEAQGDFIPSVSVGDIILVSEGYCWFSGEKEWISNPDVLLKTNGAVCPEGNGNCFSECCTYAFYYVVTAIDRDDKAGSHRCRYHVLTKAIKLDNGSYDSGYTFDVHHIKPVKAENPPASVMESSKEFIGLKAKSLL